MNAGIAYAYFGNAAYWNSDNTGAGPDQKDDQEVSLSLGLNTILSPNLKVSRSFDSTQIWYILLGLSHTFEINKVVGVNLAASGSYLISYIFPMCDDAKYDMRSRSMQMDTTFVDRQNAYLVGGISVALSF
ncbi:MAG: hypothetical protein M0Q01_08850 [Syntrophales bacterium]|jgi:hypothetical protein|nr:hypothetical protein [Syntrophales bacterium]